MTNLSESQRKYIAQLLLDNSNIPEEFKGLIFPTIEKEYELTYAGKMRKEDLLANDDGVFPVPIQVEKIFNGGEYKAFDDGWRNLIVFGDNLQLLKTINENRDPIIKDKIKGKVNLIYIDPPFATTEDFRNKDGARAYTDKKRGAEFVEFIRRRLIYAKEILAPDGSIFVHLDQKMCHQIRLVLDEIFGSNNFQNQIIWQGTSAHNDAKNKFGCVHQIIFWYGNSSRPKYNYDSVRDRISDSNLKEYSRIEMADGSIIPFKGNEHLVNENNRRFRTVDATWKGKGKQFTWRGATPNPKREWMYDFDNMEKALARGELYLSDPQKGAIRCLKRYLDENQGQILQDIWTNAGRMSGGKGTYPTEKPEVLLERIIKAVTNEGDIVMDFFGGSGTTMAVAEKLSRKWVTCDLGKLAYFTEQKRILNIQDSKSFENVSSKYGKQAKSFMTCTLGLYDLKRALNMEWNNYLIFVASLFEVDLKPHKVFGVNFEGKKGPFSVKIWNFVKYSESNVDEEYLKSVYQRIEGKMTGRVYILAPANNIQFLTDYYEINEIRFYFLRIPYQVIRELHRIPFHKLRQPQSKKNVNDLEETKGFHFIYAPEVKSCIQLTDDFVQIIIKEFKSHYYKDEAGKILENFETLSAVFIDRDFDDKQFVMTNSYFADELLPKKKNSNLRSESDSDEVLIRKELRQAKKDGLIIRLARKDTGSKLMVIYTDIYGNDFTETFTLGE